MSTMRQPSPSIQRAGFCLLALALIGNPWVVGWLVSPHGRITWGVYLSLIVYGEVLVAVAGLWVVIKGHHLQRLVRSMMTQECLWFVGFAVLVLLLVDVSFNVVAGPIYKRTSQYGWAAPANVTKSQTVQDQPGQFRTVDNRFFTAGFKRWGNLSAPGTKVFILGDSFTEMTYVSNGEEWYGYLEQAFPAVEWFVHGTGGYGSLQEYMVLNDYVDQIQPHLIVWQFCANDYMNNFYAWDSKTYPHNNFGVRPYLEQGQIVYKLPLPLPSLRRYSKLADLLLAIYDAKRQANARTIPVPTERLVTAQEQTAAYRVTRDILSMARQRAHDIPFFLFSVNQLGAREASLCDATGITCIPGVREHLDQQKAQGVTVEVVNDGHWNQAGNRAVGDYLVQYLRHTPMLQHVWAQRGD